MVIPMQPRESSSNDLKEILSEIASAKNIKHRGSGTFRIATKGQRRLTVRMTPEMQQKWVRAHHEYSQATKDTLPEMKRRASVQFAAAFRGGGFVIEVKDKGSRTAYATEETVKNIQEGKIVLQKNGGNTITYDSINVIHSEDFLRDLTSSFINMILEENEHAASLTSDAIKETIDPAHEHAIHTDITSTLKPADPDKIVSVKKQEIVKREKTESQLNEELQKDEQKALEADRDLQHAEQTKEQQEERKQDKLEYAEQKMMLLSKSLKEVKLQKSNQRLSRRCSILTLPKQ